MDHQYERHAQCVEDRCPICDGGLSVCTVCGGAEGALTTECCGESLSADQLDAIYAGKADFKAGHWVREELCCEFCGSQDVHWRLFDGAYKLANNARQHPGNRYIQHVCPTTADGFEEVE